MVTITTSSSAYTTTIVTAHNQSYRVLSTYLSTYRRLVFFPRNFVVRGYHGCPSVSMPPSPPLPPLPPSFLLPISLFQPPIFAPNSSRHLPRRIRLSAHPNMFLHLPLFQIPLPARRSRRRTRRCACVVFERWEVTSRKRGWIVTSFRATTLRAGDAVGRRVIVGCAPDIVLVSISPIEAAVLTVSTLLAVVVVIVIVV
jgi:hypothetical protein